MAQKVFVGLSGGVDSAVSAALLKERGFDVVGAFIKIWQPEFIECTWREDRLDAMRVAAGLGIPFYEVDLSEEYKKEIVEEMVRDYSRGVTPNPDILCNSKIKFGHFARWAYAQGADYVATGHYARIEKQGETLLLDLLLERGRDRNKDQSYFLYRLSREDLSRTLFPIGELTKKDVRVLAQRFGLPNAKKPDSQGLCFVGDVSMKDFLAKFIPLSAGPVVDSAGHIIGQHDGAALYTLGQRHGFSVTGARDGQAHYIVSIDNIRNTLYVSPHYVDAARAEVALRDVHWIHKTPTVPFEAEVQVRYREPAGKALLSEKNGILQAHFSEPRVASKGQSLVVYEGECCMGGGVIDF